VAARDDIRQARDTVAAALLRWRLQLLPLESPAGGGATTVPQKLSYVVEQSALADVYETKPLVRRYHTLLERR